MWGSPVLERGSLSVGAAPSFLGPSLFPSERLRRLGCRDASDPRARSSLHWSQCVTVSAPPDPRRACPCCVPAPGSLSQSSSLLVILLGKRPAPALPRTPPLPGLPTSDCLHLPPGVAPMTPNCQPAFSCSPRVRYRHIVQRTCISRTHGHAVWHCFTRRGVGWGCALRCRLHPGLLELGPHSPGQAGSCHSAPCPGHPCPTPTRP